MITIDTGPLIALFDPKDPDHADCHKVLEGIKEPLYTSEAVLTEVLYAFEPDGRGAEGVKEFFLADYVSLYPLSKDNIERCFELMGRYSDLPMDFADATLITIAEQIGTKKVFTLDYRDFNIYQCKKGHRHYSLELIGREILE